MAMLARALLTHPESALPAAFSHPAEMLPAYRRALAQSNRTLADPDTALGLLLGRDRTSVKRWLNGTGQRQVPRRSAGCWGAASCCSIMGYRASRRWSTAPPSEAAARASICIPRHDHLGVRAPYRPRKPSASRRKTKRNPIRNTKRTATRPTRQTPTRAENRPRFSRPSPKIPEAKCSTPAPSGGRTAADVA